MQNLSDESRIISPITQFTKQMENECSYTASQAGAPLLGRIINSMRYGLSSGMTAPDALPQSNTTSRTARPAVVIAWTMPSSSVTVMTSFEVFSWPRAVYRTLRTFPSW
jgi:hypothetical protein